MKNWEERFDKKFEGELWLGKYTDVDENGNQYVHRLELKDFIRRLLEEQAKEIEKFILDYMKEHGGCMDCNLSGELLAKFDHTPATDKLQISK